MGRAPALANPPIPAVGTRQAGCLWASSLSPQGSESNHLNRPTRSLPGPDATAPPAPHFSEHQLRWRCPWQSTRARLRPERPGRPCWRPGPVVTSRELGARALSERCPRPSLQKPTPPGPLSPAQPGAGGPPMAAALALRPPCSRAPDGSARGLASVSAGVALGTSWQGAPPVPSPPRAPGPEGAKAPSAGSSWRRGRWADLGTTLRGAESPGLPATSQPLQAQRNPKLRRPRNLLQLTFIFKKSTHPFSRIHIYSMTVILLQHKLNFQIQLTWQSIKRKCNLNKENVSLECRQKLFLQLFM